MLGTGMWFFERHPFGEVQDVAPSSQSDTVALKTPGGIFQVRWDPDSEVTPLGGVASFADFLDATGVFDAWIEDCPITYDSPNAPSVRDVIGTGLLSVLAGHNRYAHITGLRSDGVTPGLLGLGKLVSEDSFRRALQRIDAEVARSWQQPHLVATFMPLLSVPWVLDVDVTIKPIYGHQEGAAISYNPHKPGRPSHAYHTYIMGETRLVLDVEVAAGDEHTAATTRPGLWHWLEKMPRSHWPRLLRGDCGFGNEDMMAWPEQEGLAYLFKQRMTKYTKELVAELDINGNWIDAGEGWHGTESTLCLSTWTRSRRVVILRRPKKPRYSREKDKDTKKAEQLKLTLEGLGEALDEEAFEYQVLVTSMVDSISMIAECYRQRADAENVFDELKNQWGWAGFTTKDIDRCQITARFIAQVYNWWSIFVRMASPDHHREAVTSRPLLLNTIGRLTHHAGQRFLTITSVHAKGELVSDFFRSLANFLGRFRLTAEQLEPPQKWDRLLRTIFAKQFGGVVLHPP